MTYILIENDIFITGAKYIAHQCNCVSTSAAGIAKVIFERYPYADCYKDRTEKSIPGEIQICGDGLEKRFIINMFGQYVPGSIKDTEEDSEIARKKYFHQCLVKISQIPNLESIAFPYKIGCGLAGGNWDWYENQLKKFADVVAKVNAKVLIYKKEET